MASKFASVGADRVVRLPFRVVATTGISKSANTITVSELELKPSNLGTRVAAIAACFEYFRIVRLRSVLTSNVVGPVHYDSSILNETLGVLEGNMAMAYEPSDTSRTAVPTTLNEVAQAAMFDMGGLYARLQFDVPRKILLGTPVKWWDTTSTGSPPSGNQVQGLSWVYTFNNNVQSSANGAGVYQLLEGDIEFRGMIPPALSYSDSSPQTGTKDSASEQGWVVERPLTGLDTSNLRVASRALPLPASLDRINTDEGLPALKPSRCVPVFH